MGFVDFLVPFAAGHVILFEGVVFALAVFSVLVAWYATKRVKESFENRAASAAVSDSSSTQSLSLNRHK